VLVQKNSIKPRNPIFLLLLLRYSAGPILVLTQRVGAQRTYEHDWLLARRCQNAAHDGPSSMSSAR